MSGPSGLYDSVTMPRWSCHARSSDWLNSGCSSTWFTAGQTPVRSTISSTWAGVKFETPIDLAFPCARRSTSASHVSTYLPIAGSGQWMRYRST